MNLILRNYQTADLDSMRKLWNQIVEEGQAYPQEEGLTEEGSRDFFSSQTYCGLAEDADTGSFLGFYILHPNNIGRCGHIANASYAVCPGMRGQRIGERLVADSIEQAKKQGFRILQYNAVVKENTFARRLYEKLGFIQLGTIPGGFRRKDGEYVDICPYYREL